RRGTRFWPERKWLRRHFPTRTAAFTRARTTAHATSSSSSPIAKAISRQRPRDRLPMRRSTDRSTRRITRCSSPSQVRNASWPSISMRLVARVWSCRTTCESPDNVALDRAGNLYITEDPGGSAPTKTRGDDVWFAPFNQQSGAQSLPIQRFFSITDCNAEPSGLYMSISNRTLFVSMQHRGGDGADLTLAIQRLPDVSFNKAKR